MKEQLWRETERGSTFAPVLSEILVKVEVRLEENLKLACSSIQDAGFFATPESQVNVMKFELSVVFTPEPPPGEDYFTLELKKNIGKFPPGIVPDREVKRADRKRFHTMTFRVGKGRTPVVSRSSIFSRVALGM